MLCYVKLRRFLGLRSQFSRVLVFITPLIPCEQKILTFKGHTWGPARVNSDKWHDPKSRGFAKSRPATAWRPAAHGLEARWPTPDFPQFFCPEGNPRACTDLHRVWACKMDDGEFEFVYHFNNHFNPFWSFLSLHVAKWKTLSFSVYSLFILCLFSVYSSVYSSILHAQTWCRSVHVHGFITTGLLLAKPKK